MKKVLFVLALLSSVKAYNQTALLIAHLRAEMNARFTVVDTKLGTVSTEATLKQAEQTLKQVELLNKDQKDLLAKQLGISSVALKHMMADLYDRSRCLQVLSTGGFTRINALYAKIQTPGLGGLAAMLGSIKDKKTLEVAEKYSTASETYRAKAAQYANSIIMNKLSLAVPQLIGPPTPGSVGGYNQVVNGMTVNPTAAGTTTQAVETNTVLMNTAERVELISKCEAQMSALLRSVKLYAARAAGIIAAAGKNQKGGRGFVDLGGIMK
jgi:hypothetical protein